MFGKKIYVGYLRKTFENRQKTNKSQCIRKYKLWVPQLCIDLQTVTSKQKLLFLTQPRSNDTVRIRPLRYKNGYYTDRNTDRIIGRSNTVRSASVHSRKVTVLEENTACFRCRKTVPVITGRNGSFSAIVLPFCHGLHSENVL